MKVEIVLSSEGRCSTIREVTKEQYDFLLSIQDTMGDHEDTSYSPMMYINIVEN